MAGSKNDGKGPFVVPCVSVTEAHGRKPTIGNAKGGPPMQERIFIGHRFKSDVERSRKQFELYSKMSISAALKPILKSQA